MIKVKARIKLYENGRKTPFADGYRPLFKFIDTMLTSGHISLIDMAEFQPNSEGMVEIRFLHGEYLGEDFGVSKKFTFGEGLKPLGEGEVIYVYSA